MLILSPRLTRDDLLVWERLEMADRMIAKTRRTRLNALAERAKLAILSFASEPCTMGVSWGKDSVVLAHLVATMPVLPIVSVYFVHAPRDNPDCHLVRDAFLRRWTLRDYREQKVDPRAPGDTTSKAARYARWHREGGLPTRRITGIRAAESGLRELSAATHGVATDASCRPILRWSTSDVFAYLAMHDLPVHPAYAQSAGGVYDRQWLRVAPLGGHEGEGWGRAEWEARYYAEETRA